MISEKDVFFKGRQKVGGHLFKNVALRELEFHGALQERVFSFCWRLGVPLERPRLASWQMMMDILDVF